MSVSSLVQSSPWTTRGIAATIAVVSGQYRADVGARLRELREQRDLSQEDAAHEIGVTTKTLSRWENGRTWPYPDHWTAIRTFYGSDPRESVPTPAPLGLDASSPDGVLARLDVITAHLAAIDERLEQIATQQGLLTDTDRDVIRQVEAALRRLGLDIGRGRPQSRGARKSPPAAEPPAG